jgi:hypothetical protein
LSRNEISGLQVTLVELIFSAVVIGVLANYASDSLVAMGAPLGPWGLFFAILGIAATVLLFIAFVPVSWTTTGLCRRIYSKDRWRLSWDAFARELDVSLRALGISVRTVNCVNGRGEVRVGFISTIHFDLRWRLLRTSGRAGHIVEYSVTPNPVILLSARASAQIAAIVDALREFEYGFGADILGELSQ